MATRLQIATQNVWGLPEPFAKHVLPRMQELARSLMECTEDVLVFQEAWTAEIRKILVDGGRRAGFTHHWNPADGAGGGLLIISRLPFDQPRFERFHLTGTLGRLNRGEYLGGKGFASVRLKTEQGPVWLVNTHLHASYRSNQKFMSSAVRTAQLLQLADSLPVSGEPVIVAGDFNCNQGDAEYVIWQGLSGMRDAALAFDHPPSTISSENFYKRGIESDDRRIDYVFVENGSALALEPIASRRVFDKTFDLRGRPRPISDHFGISLTFELQPTTSVQPVEVRRAAGPNIISNARRLLEKAKAEIDREEITNDRVVANLAMLAGGAVLLRSNERVTRRGLLHRALGFAGLAAVGPAVALKAIAMSDADRQRHAFTAATQTLAKFDHDGGRWARRELDSIIGSPAVPLTPKNGRSSNG
ncbi:MAG: endonuclease/exonuclease/phosphatase family protein [Myxococcales bacterium]|nr:endonuclease/exonuclease/phosphatase family protein [Myxococcales bacterium]